LGECNELLQADYNADKLPSNKSSTKGLGRSEPNKKEWINIENDITVPIGNITSTESSSNKNAYSLLYNEYIVYNEAQIRTRFIVKIEFDFDEE
jgi:poly [ADP-ribose] polymerase